MKKSILFAMFVGGVFAANAQATATLNVNLQPVQSITIGAGSPVNMDYTNSSEYTIGKTVVVTDHLSVYSSGGFSVSVSVPAATLAGSNTAGPITQTITAAGISVEASNGTGTADGVYTPGAVALGTAVKPLFSSPTGGAAKKYTVTYKGGTDYIAKRIGTGITTYTTNVVYSIVGN